MKEREQVDIAVGFVLAKGAEPPRRLIETISAGLSTYFRTYRWALIHAHTGLSRWQRAPEAPGLNNQIPAPVPWTGVQHVTYPWHGLPAKTAGYQTLLTQAEQAGAQVCLIVDPTDDGFEPDWIDSLLRPGLYSRCDIVTPVHPARPDQRLLSANFISPLLDGLFGSAPRTPMSGTFLVSDKLRRRLLSRHDWDGGPARYVPELWMNFAAAAEGYRRAEAFVGPSRSSVAGAILPSHVALIQIVESIFSLMEQYESYWLNGRHSDPLDRFGREQQPPQGPDGPANGLEYVVRYVNAHRALREQWQAILDPCTYQTICDYHSSLLAGDDEAVLADATWTRIVYELAGAWRLRARPRHHLAGLFVPLYWARIGSRLLRGRIGEQSSIPTGQFGSLSAHFQGLRPALDRLWTGRREAAA